MYLFEFVDSCDEMFQDVSPLGEYSLPSPHLAKIAAAYIVELLNRGFDVFDFIELIYYENSLAEQECGKNMVLSDKEIPF